MIYGTSEKPSGCRMMEVRGPARLQDTVDRQTVRGKNSHCGADGKHAEAQKYIHPRSAGAPAQLQSQWYK